MDNDILNNALEIVAKTDPGMVRGHNEDAVFFNPNQGFVILADGMGGYNAGEIASGMAITMLSLELEAAFSAIPPYAMEENGNQSYAQECVREKIEKVNSAIFHAAESQPQYAGMGTTLVMALFHNNKITVAHVGDSRLYRLRGEVFEVITKDHSLLQEQIDSGVISPEDARHSLNKNLVTRALGVDAMVDVEIQELDVEVGDIYLLCSDGLNDMIEDEELGSSLHMLSANIDLAATQLIDVANDYGGRDNISIILVKVLRDFSVSRSRLSRLIEWLK